MLSDQDVTATGGGDEDLTEMSDVIHGSDLVALNSSLKGINGIDFSNVDVRSHVVQSLSAALANVTVTGNDGNLSGNHDIGGTLDTVNERFTATVQVVELGLGDRVIDVDGRDKELALLEHLVEVVNASGSLLGETVATLQGVRVLSVNERSQVTTVIKDEVKLLAILESLELLLQAPVVFLLGLTLPGETAIYCQTMSQRCLIAKFMTYTGTPAAAMAAAA